jgi:hypothetical protein
MRRAKIAALNIITLISFLLVFIPAYLIRPFVSQNARGLTIAYFLRSMSPWVTLGLGLVGGLLVLSLWQACRSRIARGGLSCVALVLLASAILSRQNHFEWMFRPMRSPGFAAVSKASHVNDSDMILGVRLAGEARAYPVRIMAYHHLVNDVIATQPFVVTY